MNIILKTLLEMFKALLFLIIIIPIMLVGWLKFINIFNKKTRFKITTLHKATVNCDVYWYKLMEKF